MKVTKEVLYLYHRETLTMLNDVIEIIDKYFRFDTFDIEVGGFIVRYEPLYYHKNPDSVVLFIENNTNFIISNMAFLKCIVMFNAIVDDNLYGYFAKWGLSNRNNTIEYINGLKLQIIREFNKLAELADVVK